MPEYVVLLTGLVGLAGLALGGYLGRRLGARQVEESVHARFGGAEAEAERILSDAQKQSDRLVDDAESKAAAQLREARSEAATTTREAESQAAAALREAESQAAAFMRDAEVEAQRLKLEEKAKVDEDARAMRAEHSENEQRLRKKESMLDKREATLDKRENTLDKRIEAQDDRESELKTAERELQQQNKAIKKRNKQSEALLEEARQKLADVADLTPEQARQSIIDDMVADARLEAGKRIKLLEEEATEEAEKRAKRLIGIAIQRYAGEYVTERCVSTITLPSDDMKGRIIGREGRNIRAIEAATGVDLIIDDTPEAVVISAFDPVRREIARLSLERLVADGRIHPTRIEEVVDKVTREIDQIIKEAGEQAAFELSLHGLHPEVLRLIGRLRYRTSYGQNMWGHSIEVGWLCGLMAAELGLNVKIARRCGLLHDIGKAIDHDQEGSHALLGADFCKKYGEKPLIINAIAAHHNEVTPESVYAHLVMAGDALSGARPGARREILETYIRRLEDLERISLTFDGVEKCYALQAGREIRVMVSNSRVNDATATLLSKDIARKIEQELTYPGQIKVTVIRETRATDFAR